MKKRILFALIFSIGFTSFSQTLRQVIQTYRVKTKAACDLKNAYWYNDKCWVNYKDKNIQTEKTDWDELAKKYTKQLQNTKITINNIDYPIDAFYPEKDNLYLKFILHYTDSISKKTIRLKVRNTIVKVRKQFMSEIQLNEENKITNTDSIAIKKIAAGRVKTNYSNFDKKDFIILGKLRDLKNPRKTYSINFVCNEALWKKGTTTLDLRGNKAIINGIIGINTYSQIRNILDKHPEVEILVFETISGSVDESITNQISIMIQKSRLNTKVLSNSTLSLSGVKLFSSGKKRIYTHGAKLGVNSWDNGLFKGSDLPKDHPLHQSKVAFYKHLLGKKGSDFYYYTLQKDPLNKLRWLDENQILNWGIATNIVDDIPIKIQYPNIPNKIANLGFSYGNSQSNTVIIYTQAIPDLYLHTDKFQKMFSYYGGVDPKKYFLINVHQIQTLHPEIFQNNEIEFDKIKEYNSKNTEILENVIQYFKSQNKKIILVGMSYSTYLIQDYLTKDTTNIDTVLLLTGRLDMEKTAWENLSQGNTILYQEDQKPITKNNKNSIIEKNQAKLWASYAKNRYTELLKNASLSNLIFIYAKKDEMIGSLSKKEIDFLTKKDVLLLSIDKSHNETLYGFLKKGMSMILK